MPLFPTSFFLPSSPALPFLMEDVYLKGGYRCVADEAARDAISVAARKPGMRVYVINNGTTWTVAAGALTTWIRAPGVTARATHNYTPSNPIPVNGHVDFTVGTGKTAIINMLEVGAPDLVVECHSTSSRADTNPYKFVSYTGHLVDDGSSKLDDGSIQYNRRYGIVCNQEATPGVNTYWRVYNRGSAPVTPTIKITYLSVEA